MSRPEAAGKYHLKATQIKRPILRGRDIKRYGYVWDQDDPKALWLINTHNGVKGKYPPINIDEYPSIKQHLNHYWDKISARDDKGITPYNLRNCAYLDDFFKPKIIFQEIVQESQFAFDSDTHFMCNDTCRIIVGNNINFLLGVLNSKLFFFAIKTYYGGGGLGEHAVRMKHTFFGNYPCVNTDDIVNRLVQRRISTNDDSLDVDIDKRIYELYHLSDEEIRFVEHKEH